MLTPLACAGSWKPELWSAALEGCDRRSTTRQLLLAAQTDRTARRQAAVSIRHVTVYNGQNLEALTAALAANHAINNQTLTLVFPTQRQRRCALQCGLAAPPSGRSRQRGTGVRPTLAPQYLRRLLQSSTGVCNSHTDRGPPAPVAARVKGDLGLTLIPWKVTLGHSAHTNLVRRIRRNADPRAAIQPGV